MNVKQAKAILADLPDDYVLWIVGEDEETGHKHRYGASMEVDHDRKRVDVVA